MKPACSSDFFNLPLIVFVISASYLSAEFEITAEKGLWVNEDHHYAYYFKQFALACADYLKLSERNRYKILSSAVNL
jgi:hypothetical protein